MISENPSDQIKKKIKETGIKQVHLAKKLGITPQYLNKILAENREKSQYLPKMAEILGLDKTDFELDNIKNVPILSEKYLKSFADGLISFDALEQINFKSWPCLIEGDYYFFGYELTDDISSQIIKNDLLIFSSCINCNITKKIGIAFIKDMGLIFTGKLKYNQNKIVIHNEHDFFEFKPEDQLLGVAVYLERNMETWLK